MKSEEQAGRAALLAGRLDEARAKFEVGLSGDPDRADLRRVLGLAAYRANDFARAAEAYQGVTDLGAAARQLRSFGGDAPYQLGGPPSTRLAWLMTDPLPLIEIVVDTLPLHALIDTGGGQLILDTELAGELGVETIAEVSGTFGGRLQASVGLGRVDRVQLGEVTLDQVPVNLLPTRRFSAVTGGRYRVDAIVGTNVLAQFRATLDYIDGALILEDPRHASSHLAGVHVPFEFHGDHYMTAEGSLNGLTGLRLFVDSGLAGGALMCGTDLLQRAGIETPAAAIADGSVGGGGGQFATGTFAIDELGLGSLTQRD